MTEARLLVSTAAIGMLVACVASADLYVRQVSKTDAYVDGEMVSSQEGDSSVMWMADRKLALSEGNKTILVDLDRRWFCLELQILDRI